MTDVERALRRALLAHKVTQSKADPSLPDVRPAQTFGEMLEANPALADRIQRVVLGGGEGRLPGWWEARTKAELSESGRKAARARWGPPRPPKERQPREQSPHKGTCKLTEAQINEAWWGLCSDGKQVCMHALAQRLGVAECTVRRAVKLYGIDVPAGQSGTRRPG